MKRYSFGLIKEYGRYVDVEAPDVDTAVKFFKVKVLFPERYVPDKFIKKRGERDEALDRYVHEYKANSSIPVYEEVLDDSGYVKKHVKLLDLPLVECIDMDYRLILNQPLIEGAVSESLENQVDKAISFSEMQNKMELRSSHDQLQRMKYEFELKRSEMLHQLALLQAEVDRKTRVLYALTTYMGMNEKVIVLRQGERAAEELPVSVYQQLLYMDEETGVWEEGGLDVRSIGVFDEWITKNYDKFLYKEKSVCAFRVRRESKHYSDDPWVNASMNEGNFRTYFLIRNGENLYRIWSDVKVPETLFPSKDRLEEIYKEHKDWDDEYLQKQLGKEVRPHLFCFAALQGLIDRTEILGTRLRGKVNLMKLDGFTSDQVELIRDAEQEYWISDGHPSWEEFLKTNAKSVVVGSRVCMGKFGFYFSEIYDRTYPFRPDSAPSRGVIYQVEGMILADGDRHHRRLVIRYNPKDTVYPWDYWEPAHERKHRVPFRFYDGEFLNIDEISEADCEYYLHNRNERRHYLELMPTLHWIKKVKEKERLREEEFVKLVVARLSLNATSHEDLERVRSAIAWWKLKNKWKRGLDKDDTLALRMIEKRVKNPTYMDSKTKKEERE